MNPSIRKPFIAVLLAVLFALALGVGFAASSAGEEEQPVEPVGSAAVPLDVPAAGAARTGLAEAAALPAMARKPEPPPPPPEPEEEDFPEEPVETFPEEPVEPEPVVPEPAPPPVPEPEPPPPVEFDDEG